MQKILILSDNEYLADALMNIVKLKRYKIYQFDFFYSYSNKSFNHSLYDAKPINLKNNSVIKDVISEYSLIISLHCKQIFPPKLVENIRCVNVHPGFNPYNRGFFPQVFSIINGFPAGVTIHEMDEQVDHGDIIVQQQYIIKPYETSQDVYVAIQQIETALLNKHLLKIIKGDYTTFKPIGESNYNSLSDFNALCKIDMEKIEPIGDTVKLLRALTFFGYKNAYFIYNNRKFNLDISVNSHHTK